MSFPRGPMYDGYHQQDRRTQPNMDNRFPPQLMDSNMEQRRYESAGQLSYNDPRMRGYPQPPGARHPDPRFPSHAAHPTHPGYEKRFNPENKPNFNDRANFGNTPVMHSRQYDEYGGGSASGRQFPPMSSHHHDPYKSDGYLGPPPHRMVHPGMGIGVDYPTTSRAPPRGAPPSMGPGLGGHFPDFPPSHLQSLERGPGFGHLDLNYSEIGLHNLPGESRGPPAPQSAISSFPGHQHGESRGPVGGSAPSSVSGFQTHSHGMTDAPSIPRAALHNINPQVLTNVPPVIDTLVTPTVTAGPPIVETLPVPSELSSVASDPGFMEIISRVKEQLQLLSLTFGRATDGSADSLIIEATSREKASLAKNLLETHLKQQWKIKMAESRLQKIQTDLHSTQGEIMSGHMVEVIISPELVGLTIGKKGTRIKQIEADTGVNNINVGDNGHIVIYGPDSSAVQRAREQLELKEEKVSLSPQQLDWMSNKVNGNIVAELRTSAGLMLAKINFDTHSLEMIGTHQSVSMAQLLLSTQLEYIDKQIEIENSERAAREKLHAARKQLGMGGNWKNRNSSHNSQNQIHTPNDEAREFSLPPPPGLSAKNPNTSQQPLKPKSVDESLDALISSAELVPRESGPVVSSKQKKQQSQQQQQTHGNKGQKTDKKGNKHEAFSFNDTSPSVDLFEISQASARMKVDHPQHKFEQHHKEQGEASKSKSRQHPDNKDKQKEKASTRENNDLQKDNNGISKKGGRTVHIESKDDAARTVLPPPPTLTVPENKQREEDKKKQPKEKKEKDKKKSKKKDEEASQTKEPMLTKINLPFQKSSMLSSISQDGNPATSVVIPIPPQRSSGPPKDFSLSVIPPSGPPAKELSSTSSQLSAPSDSSSGKQSEAKDEKIILEEENNKKKQQRKSRASEVNTTSDEGVSIGSKDASTSKDGNQREFSVKTDNSNVVIESNLKPQSPPAQSGSDKRNSESSTRRANASKAAIMDSLMTVRPDGAKEPISNSISTVVHTPTGKTDSPKRKANEDNSISADNANVSAKPDEN